MRFAKTRFAKTGFAKTAVAALVLAVVGIVGASGAAMAQEDQSRPRVSRRPPLRIEVEPQRRMVRECQDTHVIEHRLTGDTIVPRTRCWWALR